jgi:hypothetical protein
MNIGSWSLRVDDLTDIYSETRVVDMLRTVKQVAVERVDGKDGATHVNVEVPNRSVARLIREMVTLIDSHATVSHVRPRLLTTT